MSWAFIVYGLAFSKQQRIISPRKGAVACRISLQSYHRNEKSKCDIIVSCWQHIRMPLFYGFCSSHFAKSNT